MSWNPFWLGYCCFSSLLHEFTCFSVSHPPSFNCALSCWQSSKPWIQYGASGCLQVYMSASIGSLHPFVTPSGGSCLTGSSTSCTCHCPYLVLVQIVLVHQLPVLCHRHCPCLLLLQLAVSFAARRSCLLDNILQDSPSSLCKCGDVLLLQEHDAELQLIWPVRWWKCPNSLHRCLCMDRYWCTKYSELIAGNAMDMNMCSDASNRPSNPPNGGSYVASYCSSG